MSNGINIDAICDLRKQRKLVPFIGAGFSTRFGFPSWDELIALIAQELDWDPDVFKLNGNNLQLAEYYYLVKGTLGAIRSLMDRRFNPPDSEIRTSRAHEYLTKLQFPIIYTTNYDDILERAFSLYGASHHVINNIDDIKITSPEETQIVKFHGSLNFEDSSLVLTETNYFERLSFESPLDIKLRSDMLGKSLLFIGYGLSDINIRYMIYRLQVLKKRYQRVPNTVPTAIMTTFSPSEIQQRILSDRDVRIFNLDPIDRNRSIDDFLEKLL